MKAEIVRNGLKHEEIARRLHALGYEEETAQSIYNKLGRGTFQLAWALAVFKVLGVKVIRLEED